MQRNAFELDSQYWFRVLNKQRRINEMEYNVSTLPFSSWPIVGKLFLVLSTKEHKSPSILIDWQTNGSHFPSCLHVRWPQREWRSMETLSQPALEFEWAYSDQLPTKLHLSYCGWSATWLPHVISTRSLPPAAPDHLSPHESFLSFPASFAATQKVNQWRSQRDQQILCKWVWMTRSILLLWKMTGEWMFHVRDRDSRRGASASVFRSCICWRRAHLSRISTTIPLTTGTGRPTWQVSCSSGSICEWGGIIVAGKLRGRGSEWEIETVCCALRRL